MSAALRTRRHRPARKIAAAASRERVERQRAVVIGICFAIAILVLIAFGHAAGFGFLNFDDNVYVYANPWITNGLSFSGVVWAFTHVHADNWHPLTTISHMFDCQMFGVDPAGHHVVNILLHSAAAVLLFFALRRLVAGTDSRHVWMCAFVAVLFAVHPLRVESVAWVAERKDVLSGVLFMLTLLAYAGYARNATRSPVKYAAVLLFFTAGLLCKPTLVTMPFLLLLVDYWPLGRVGDGQASPEGFRLLDDDKRDHATWQIWSALIEEKTPFFLLSAASCVATIVAQTKGIADIHKFTPAARIANALISYVVYIGHSFWPAHLSIWYPFPRVPHYGAAVAALVFLSGVTVATFYWRKTYPFLLVGWFWFLGVLVPMIGLLQVGQQARADRYAYLSTIGLYIMIVWGAVELIRRRRVSDRLVMALAGLIITALVVRTYMQVRVWEDSFTLWQHAIDIVPDDHIPHYNLANALAEADRSDEAIAEYRRALELEPNDAEIQTNLCSALSFARRLDEATVACEAALRLDPNAFETYSNLGVILSAKGRPEEAAARFREAIHVKPDYAAAHLNLARALQTLGHGSEAALELAEGQRLQAEQNGSSATRGTP